MPAILGKTISPASVPGGEPSITINFESGEKALLDAASPQHISWAGIIEQARQDHRRVYVETEAATNRITRLCIPEAARISGIENATGEMIEVSLYTSSPVYYLERNQTRFQNMLELLRGAMENNTPVLLTATLHTYHIVDVRALPADMQDQQLLKAPAVNEDRDIDGVLKPVTPERAQELFKMIEARSCIPLFSAGKAETCIPFKYPGGGCNIRAHLMAWQLRRNGETPVKIWSEGKKLRAHTMNDPQCYVSWDWHVAVALLVRHSDGKQEKVVFDPSLFDRPATVAEWTTVQGDKLTRFYYSSWKWYDRFGKEADEATADKEMRPYKGFLNDLWVVNGPAPYEKCRLSRMEDGERS